MASEVFTARESNLNPTNSIRQKGSLEVLSRKDVDAAEIFSSSPRKIQTKLHNMMYSGKTESVDNDVQVDTDKLIPTQKRLNTKDLRRYMDSKIKDDNPIVVGYRGKTYIIDGHHRIAAAILNGNKRIRVERYNLKD